VLAVAGGFLAILVFTSLPRIPLLLIGACCVGMAVTLTRRERKTQAVAAAKHQAQAVKSAQRVEDYLTIDPMELELGLGLLRCADARRGGDLLDRIQRVRQNLAAEMGVILPKVRVRDNMRLEPNQYRINIAGQPVAQATIDRAASEPGSTIAAHLNETVRRHADELLTRDSVKHLIDELRQTSPTTVDELIPGVLKLGEVQQVLQLLLREEVPIRQLGPILEALGDYAPRTKDPILLAEFVRQRLARTLCTRYRDRDLRLHVVTFDPALEERIRAGFEYNEDGLAICLAPGDVDEVCRLIAAEIEKLSSAGRPPVVLVAPPVRSALRRLTATHIPQLIVLSYNEITRDTRIESVAMISDAGGWQSAAEGGAPNPHFRGVDAAAKLI
jgi:flagellar biosynthesis protein FlhA